VRPSCPKLRVVADGRRYRRPHQTPGLRRPRLSALPPLNTRARVGVAPVGFEHERERASGRAAGATRTADPASARLRRDETRERIGRAGDAAASASFDVPRLAVVRNARSAAAAVGGWRGKMRRASGTTKGRREEGGREGGRKDIRYVRFSDDPIELCPKTDRFHFGMRNDRCLIPFVPFDERR